MEQQAADKELARSDLVERQASTVLSHAADYWLLQLMNMLMAALAVEWPVHAAWSYHCALDIH